VVDGVKGSREIEKAKLLIVAMSTWLDVGGDK